VGVGGRPAAKANNQYMGAEYDPNADTSFISYIDANNLCKVSIYFFSYIIPYGFNV
jgi:hypothetical protein